MNESRNFNPVVSDYDDCEAEHSVQLDPRVVEAIGKALKAHYQDILDLPVPDSMLVLLAELEARERAKNGR